MREPPLQVTHSGPWSIEDVRHWIQLLNTLKSQRRVVRRAHFFPDIALGMLAHHVSEYANAILLVLESEVPGTAYPLVRAAFEAEIDVLYLTASGERFDFEGARAYVASRVADYTFAGLQRRADARRDIQWPDMQTVPLRKLVRADAEAWDRWSPGKGAIMLAALKAVQADRAAGRRHWSGLSRSDLHQAVATRLSEPGLEITLRGIYDQMATRSHSGLRLGHYLTAEGPARLRLSSKPDLVDPFPLQTLGHILYVTVDALAGFHVENPVDPDELAGALPA
jgi:hypothetical protein